MEGRAEVGHSEGTLLVFLGGRFDGMTATVVLPLQTTMECLLDVDGSPYVILKNPTNEIALKTRNKNLALTIMDASLYERKRQETSLGNS